MFTLDVSANKLNCIKVSALPEVSKVKGDAKLINTNFRRLSSYVTGLFCLFLT